MEVTKCSYCGVIIRDDQQCSPTTQNCNNLMEFHEKFDKDYHS